MSNQSLGVGVPALAFIVCFVLSGCVQQSGSTGSSTSATVTGKNSATARLDRGTFTVEFEETLGDEPTDLNVARELFRLGMAAHGFSEVEDPAQARFAIRGESRSKFLKIASFEYLGQETLLEHQYTGVLTCNVTDNKSKMTEQFAVPELMHGRNDDRDAQLDIRRAIATQGFNLAVNGSLLGNPDVKALLDALNDKNEQRTFNQIAKELAAIGNPAVPYLLDALRDEREVVVPGTYPGLDEDSRADLHYCHVADLALSDIFMQKSGLDLDSDHDYVVRVITAWTWVWEDRQGIPEKHRVHAEQRSTKVPANLEQE